MIDNLLNELKDAFNTRKFAAGVLIAMIDFLTELDIPSLNVRSFQDLLEVFPRQRTTAHGKRANTLIVRRGESTLSLRPFYNNAERLFRAEHKRYDYPSCAPHATQSWQDYTNWLDSLCKMDQKELQILKGKVIDFVLNELPDQGYQQGSIETIPPLFQIILEDFDFTAPRGEPSGAAFQGAAFGFIRADNPHLQVEIDKVRTGSRRLQRVGDIDAWDGERLAVTAEVKSLEVTAGAVQGLVGFANEVLKRGAIGLLIALSFTQDAKKSIEERGLRSLDLDNLIGIVELWDPSKQKIAIESMIYYATHVEKNSALKNRLKEFLKGILDGWPKQNTDCIGSEESQSTDRNS